MSLTQRLINMPHHSITPSDAIELRMQIDAETKIQKLKVEVSQASSSGNKTCTGFGDKFILSGLLVPNSASSYPTIAEAVVDVKVLVLNRVQPCWLRGRPLYREEGLWQNCSPNMQHLALRLLLPSHFRQQVSMDSLDVCSREYRLRRYLCSHYKMTHSLMSLAFRSGLPYLPSRGSCLKRGRSWGCWKPRDSCGPLAYGN